MSRGCETRPDKPARPAPRLAWCVLALLAGCQGTSPSPRIPDPLVTSSPLPLTPAAGAATGATAAGSTESKGTVPPLPAQHSLTSQAALAGGGAPPPVADTSRNNLRINDGSSTPSAGTAGSATAWPLTGAAAGSTGGWPATGSGSPPGTALQAPEPSGAGRLAPVAASPTVPFKLAASSGPAAPGDGYQQLQEMLRVRGVSWQRLETWGDAGEWKFRCSVPDPQKPGTGHNYEARAAGENGLAAIRAVLDQIDRDRATPQPR